MPPSIMPAFVSHPKEAAIIGRLLAGYGEIEYEFTYCLAEALAGDFNTAFRTLFRLRGEEQKLEIGDALMRHKFDASKLADQYAAAYAAARHCKSIRNQYAHCHWVDFWNDEFLFTTFEAGAKKKSGDIHVLFYEVDEPLLEKQEAFFVYTATCFRHLSHQLKMLEGRSRDNPYKKPAVMVFPEIHKEAKDLPIEPTSKAPTE